MPEILRYSFYYNTGFCVCKQKIQLKIPLAVLFLFELTCYYREFGEAISWYRTLYAVSSASVIICLIYLFFMIFSLTRKQNEILQQLGIQKEYSESQSRGDEELRAFRHDYKNHMLVVNALLSSGRTDEAQKYLESISGDIKQSVNRIATGNYIADAILNNKAASLARQNAELSFSGKIPSKGIKNEDLCTVLTNLLDNAEEAVSVYGGRRYVDVTAKSNGHNFYLKIENPSAIKDKKGIFQTTKQDRRNHGIGLKNVRRVAEEYDGELLTEACGTVFTAEVMMQIN